MHWRPRWRGNHVTWCAYNVNNATGIILPSEGIILPILVSRKRRCNGQPRSTHIGSKVRFRAWAMQGSTHTYSWHLHFGRSKQWHLGGCQGDRNGNPQASLGNSPLCLLQMQSRMRAGGPKPKKLTDRSGAKATLKAECSQEHFQDVLEPVKQWFWRQITPLFPRWRKSCFRNGVLVEAKFEVSKRTIFEVQASKNGLH